LFTMTVAVKCLRCFSFRAVAIPALPVIHLGQNSSTDHYALELQFLTPF
jgi:hypothetical protein